MLLEPSRTMTTSMYVGQPRRRGCDGEQRGTRFLGMGPTREEVIFSLPRGGHIQLKHLLGTSDMQARESARLWVNVERNKRGEGHMCNLLK